MRYFGFMSEEEVTSHQNSFAVTWSLAAILTCSHFGVSDPRPQQESWNALDQGQAISEEHMLFPCKITDVRYSLRNTSSAVHRIERSHVAFTFHHDPIIC